MMPDPSREREVLPMEGLERAVSPLLLHSSLPSINITGKGGRRIGH